MICGPYVSQRKQVFPRHKKGPTYPLQFGWGLDGGSWGIYRAVTSVSPISGVTLSSCAIFHFRIIF